GGEEVAEDVLGGEGDGDAADAEPGDEGSDVDAHVGQDEQQGHRPEGQFGEEAEGGEGGDGGGIGLQPLFHVAADVPGNQPAAPQGALQHQGDDGEGIEAITDFG